MTWKLSRFRSGDWVEVRSREEILAGLDANGRLDGMPFMPEMLAFCGKRYRVRAVAHKTCDTARQTWTGRRLDRAVHLEGAFCDGSAHGGCEAECALFWKDAWLKPIDGPDGSAKSRSGTAGRACTEGDLHAQTHRTDPPSGESRYACQATELYDFTEPLRSWDPRQYLYDIRTGNRSASHVIRVVLLAGLRWLVPRVPIGYRLFRALDDWAHRVLTGRPSPRLTAHVEDGQRTPTGRLGLARGERVRIKPQSEIEPTLDRAGKNRGLSFDSQEMAPYCGRIVEVHKLVTKIIEEPTGRMIEMKQPCVMLRGVVCRAEYADQRLNCPREIKSYWREIWLERVGSATGIEADFADD
jgi:hypothetical protein